MQLFHTKKKKMPESYISFLLDDRLSASQMCSGCCKLLRGEDGKLCIKKSTIYTINSLDSIQWELINAMHS